MATFQYSDHGLQCRATARVQRARVSTAWNWAASGSLGRADVLARAVRQGSLRQAGFTQALFVS
jgi:hypothetical protein